MVAKVLFWSSLGALAWTHLAYPIAVAGLARVRQRPVRKADATPPVTVVVAAHNEEGVIAERVANLLALDYPRDAMAVVVASDGSTDATDAVVAGIAQREPRVDLLRCPREGKVAAQHRAVRQAGAPIVAFTDANSSWAPDALRKLVRNFADPEVGYACGRVALEAADGTNREGAYWRYEMWLRENESRLGSITGGNGAIYAVRREDYVEDDPRFGHDLGFPYLMAQRGRRAVYEPEAVAFEKQARDVEDEYGRKTRMLAQSWLHVLSGRMLRRASPLYVVQLVSHRVLRYASGTLHVVLLAASAALVGRGLLYELAFSAQVAWLLLAVAGWRRLPIPGAALSYYYATITAATLTGLVHYLRSGAPVVWEKAEGTR